MTNFIMALRYSEPFLPGLEEKYEPDIQGHHLPNDSDSKKDKYFEPVIKLSGDARKKVKRMRFFEREKRMKHTEVIYVRKHSNPSQLEREYKTQLEKAMQKSDVILIEPKSLCRYVSRTIKFGFYFFLLCLGLSAGSLFVGRCYRYKTYLMCSLFAGGSLLTIFYSSSYETWPIADFEILPDPLLCGVYCSPAVIFKTENPVAIFRKYDRFDRVQFLYYVAAAAGIQVLYRLYTGLPPYLCPCSSNVYPEFPRYAGLLFPLLIGSFKPNFL
ncbi:unnamed protein product [Allacma fusca]|uniref:Uncharacterized protein n=1 Tax=Allacma fusca TaxID=39272 RepID=A0A8J2MGS5_9HEXA|nr:unnamed protein product [Allacma fusca]